MDPSSRAGAAIVRLRPGSRTATHDPRWPAIVAALTALRDRERHAVRIVDLDCGAGCVLLAALRYARALGFTAIEGRGLSTSPALVGRANAAAARFADPATGVVFEAATAAALDEEGDLPPDIVLCHADTLRVPGGVVIADRAMQRRMAA